MRKSGAKAPSVPFPQGAAGAYDLEAHSAPAPADASAESVPGSGAEPVKKRPKKPSPTWLTKERLEQMGATFDVVEQRIPTTFITRDYLGFADIIACSPSQGIVAIQVTSSANHASRETKIEAEPRAASWMNSSGRVEVWSWGKKGKRGAEKVWALRRTRAFLVEGRIGWAVLGDGA